MGELLARVGRCAVGRLAAGSGLALGEQGTDDGGELAVVDAFGAGGGGQVHRGIDAAGDVGAAGGRVVVGGVVERLDRDPDRLGPRQTFVPQLFQGAAGEQRTGADRVVVLLGVTAAGDVE